MTVEIFIRDVGFTLPNATGDFTITDTLGPGLTPKGCIIVLSGATSLNTETNGARIAMGFTDGTDSIALGWMAEDGVIAANADTGRRRANDKILNMQVTTTEALAVGATFVSVGTNSLTINLDAASTLKGFVRFFYGAQISCKVTTVTSSASLNGVVSTSSLGFQADGCIVMSGRNAWGVDAGLNNAYISIGCAGRLNGPTQACIGLAAGDRNDPTSCGMMARNDRVLSIVISTAGVISEACSIQLTDFAADTIEFTTRTLGEAVGIGVMAFSLSGEKCFADLPVLNTDAMGTSSYVSAGYRARSIFLVGSAAATVGSLDNSVAAMSIGVYSPQTVVTGEFSSKWNSKDNQSTSVTTCAIFENQIAHVESKWAARMNQITPTGFDYNVLVASSADLPTLVFLMGSQPGDMAWLDARSGHRWRRQLARM